VLLDSNRTFEQAVRVARSALHLGVLEGYLCLLRLVLTKQVSYARHQSSPGWLAGKSCGWPDRSRIDTALRHRPSRFPNPPPAR